MILVHLTSLPPPPVLPVDYLLVGFEVLSSREPRRQILAPQSGATVALRTEEGDRFSAIAWFAERGLDDCEPGQERLVSNFEPAGNAWSEWRAEPRVQATALPAWEAKVKRRRYSTKAMNSRNEHGDILGGA